MTSVNLRIGDSAPEFSLPATDGRTYSLAGFDERPILVIIFSCNHCPYVLAYEDRLIAIQHDYADRGVQLVAVNSNDDRHYPEDSFPNMVERARAKGYPFPYLRDASQDIARRYGATHTPQLFVFGADRRLRYTGKIDDNWQKPQAVNRHYLRDTLDAILKNSDPPEAVTYAIGCTIKWEQP